MAMTRRDAMKAGLGGMLSSWMLPLATVRKSIDLSLLCDPIRFRYDLGSPFVQQAWTYATNGYAAVRIDDDTRGDTVGERRVPLMDYLPWADATSGGWRRFEDFTSVGIPNDGWSISSCPECYGRGRVGPGVVFCTPETCQDEDCDEMYHGGIICPACQDRGVDYDLMLEGLRFQPGYVQIFREVGAEYRLSEFAHPNRDGRGILQIRFEGGCGLLMPVDR